MAKYRNNKIAFWSHWQRRPCDWSILKNVFKLKKSLAKCKVGRYVDRPSVCSTEFCGKIYGGTSPRHNFRAQSLIALQLKITTLASQLIEWKIAKQYDSRVDIYSHRAIIRLTTEACLNYFKSGESFQNYYFAFFNRQMQTF